MRKDISGEVRGQLNGLISAEAEMLRRMTATAIADWIRGSPARRTRARKAFGVPKGKRLTHARAIARGP
jgi:hypothetical protein